MSMLSLAEVAAMVEGRHLGTDAALDGVSTDTRTLRPGELFVALRGPHYDGHGFVRDALERGAAGVMVEIAPSAAPAVVVDDTRRALGRLGQAWRARCPARVIGLTGSNGKTTLKGMIAAILAQRGSVLATCGNLNNDIGVPLTLCELRGHDFGVIEMGANHAGEIDYLTRLVHPDIAVLNNAGRAHLEGFGSVAGVARAKAEIIHGLGEDGVFVFNADDAYAGLWRELAGARRQRTFGIRHPADVSSPVAEYTIAWDASGFAARFPVSCDGEPGEIALPLAGEHNRMNALGAIAAATAAGATLAQAAAGLAGVTPVPGRLCPVAARNGARLIDDSYNANPDSVAAAVAVLASAPGRRTLVLGDLAELGADAAAIHRRLGEQLDVAAVDRLLTVGVLSAAAGEGFAGEHRHFERREALIDALAAELGADDSVLIKGSRSARLDEVVRALAAGEGAC